MSTVISSGMEQAQKTVKGLTSGFNGKVQDLKRDTVDINGKKGVITTDTGVKVSDTDDWLKVSTEHRTGPMLLEDQIAREKVWVP
jgi:catalase